jgi:tetratricopeptide (TPR) repeat protein
MSFTPDSRNVIADDSSNLGALRPLLQRAPAWKNGAEKEEFLRLHLQMKEIHEKVSQSLRRPEQAQSEEQVKLDQLKKELATYVETLKKSSMDFFNQGQYQDCYEVLALLVEIEPDNQAARDFLEIAGRKILESRDEHYSDSDSEAHPASAVKAGDILTDEGETSHPIPSSESAAHTLKPRSRKRWLALAFTGLLLLGILAGVRRRSSEPISTTSFEIQSDPDSANVFLNGLLIGKTGLHLNLIEPGSYNLRLEKEGYAPLARLFVVEKGQPGIIALRLEKLETNPDSLVSLREKAQALFDLGDLAEAGLICNTILDRDPEDGFALRLKENIHDYYFAPLVHEKSDSPAETRPIETAQLQSHDSQTDTTLSKHPLDTAPDPRREVTGPKSNAVKPDVGELAQAAKPAPLANLNPLQAAPGTTRPSGSSSVSSPPGPPKLDSAAQEIASQVQAKIQAREFDQAKNLLSQIQNNPSAQSDWKSLTEKLRTEEARQQSLALPWIQKAESALVLSRYVTPPDDNVLLYCNRALAADPQNQKALALKKDVIGRSVVQAREWIDRGKFDEARLFYSSLNYLSQNDNRFPISRHELQQELTKLEFASYPVIHQHKLGSCRGRLRMNGYVVSFVPSEDPSDGFTEKLAHITLVDASDDLKLKVKDKSYRFWPNAGQGKEASQKAAKPMSEQLMKLLPPPS